MTPRWRRALEILALAAGLLLTLRAVREIERAATTTFPADLVVDHRAARAFWSGYSPFSEEGARRAGLGELGPTGLGHPPTTSFWLLPLAPLELNAARQVLAWLSLATLVAEVAIAALLL